MAQHETALCKLIEAWEALPEGTSNPDMIQHWLMHDMKPAVEQVRTLLGLGEEDHRVTYSIEWASPARVDIVQHTSVTAERARALMTGVAMAAIDHAIESGHGRVTIDVKAAIDTSQ